MAIRNGERSETPAPTRRTRQARNPAEKPGLFFRTVIPSGAVTASISCSLILPHTSDGSGSSDASSSGRAARQLVVSSGSRVTLHTLNEATGALHELSSLQLFATVRDMRAMSSPVPGRDVLIVLTERNKVSFVHFDDQEFRLRVAGQVSVLNYTGPVSESRLVATHPRKWICAVASLSSRVVVFPVLFLRKDVSAGKIVRVDIDGVILGLDFLEDEDGLPSDAILLVLVQRGGEQWIALYTVGVQPGSSGGSGGLSVTHVGSMITCSERSDDITVARHAAKLGTELRAPAQALGLMRIPRSPFLFAVFLEGRVIAADARPVIVGALEARDSFPLAVRVRSERHPVHIPPAWHSRSATDGAVVDGDAFNEDASRDHLSGGDNTSQSSTDRPLVPLGMISGTARSSRSVAQRRGLASALPDGGHTDPYLSFLYVPSCVSLDLGTGEGVPTAWTNACDHFCFDPASDCDENGMYVVMESGALFALRWSTVARKGACAIPTEERTRTGPRTNFLVEYAGHVGPSVSIAALDKNLLYIANDGADGSLRRVQPPRVAKAPSTDSRWATLARLNPKSLLAASVVSSVGYELEVQQEFLNLSPISDFIIIPPGGVKPVVRYRASRSAPHLRKGDCPSPTLTSPPCHSRRMSKRARNAQVPQSRKGRQDPQSPDRRASHLELVSSTPGSSSRKNWSARSSLEYSQSLAGSPSSRRPSMSDVGCQSRRPGHFVEPEIVLCCGLQKSGSIRIVKPGAPVTLFSSSDNGFEGCNDMWSIRLSAHARHDAMIALSFTQSTRVLFAIPPTALSNREGGSDPISHLMDATNSTNIIAETRSVAVGRLEDGLIAQVHSCGVRTILFLKKSEIQMPLESQKGEICSPLVKHFWDWTVPDGYTITVAGIGAKLVFVSVVRSQCRSPCLIVLRQHSVDEYSGGLSVVTQLELNDQLSCISVPEWPGMEYGDERENKCPSPQFPLMVVLGTYAPSVEVWALGPENEMECLAAERIAPCFPTVAARMLAEQVKEEDEEGHGQVNTSSTVLSNAVGQDGASDRGQLWTRKASSAKEDDTESAQKVFRGAIMTGVPESFCTFESCGKQWIFAGLRNGTVLRYTVDFSNGSRAGSPSLRRERRLQLMARNRIGEVPVRLCRVFLSSGAAIVAQAERPWIASLECADLQWVPVSFPETRAWCSYSVPGADSCMAAVTMDDVMHICGLRRLAPVSIRSILVGDTPRRVVALNSPVDSLLVATWKEPAQRSAGDSFEATGARSWGQKNTDAKKSVAISELKVFHKFTKKLMGISRLKPDELVHVLLKWDEFIVVGTSCGLRSVRNPGGGGVCRKGRLLLYSISSNLRRAFSSQSPGKKEERASLELCSEVIMPGAVLAGAVHSSHDFLVLSANETVFLFGKLKCSFFEVARFSTRHMVVSISLYGSTICVADRKDSVGFFRLNWATGEIVRDRTDHENRIVADAAMVDSRTAMVTDKFGEFFSLIFDDGDRGSIVDENFDGKRSVFSLLPESMQSELLDADDVMSGSVVPRIDSLAGRPRNSVRMEVDGGPQEVERDGAVGESSVGVGGGTGQEDGALADSSESSAVNGTADESNDVSSTTGPGDEDMENEDSSVSEDVSVDGDENVVHMEDHDDDDDEGVMLQLGGDEQPILGLDGGLLLGFGGNNGPFIGLHHLLPVRSRPGDELGVRNLFSHHSINMRDAAMRVRYGTFRRYETVAAMRPTSAMGVETSFWMENRKAVFAGTLGGGLVCAVPISAETVTVLSEIGDVLVSDAHVCGFGIEPNHRRNRPGRGVVDGDLLQLFLTLGAEEQRNVARMAGFVGEESAFQIASLIEELCGQVG